MTSRKVSKRQKSGSRSGQETQSSDNPFWNLIQLDQNTIDKELDTAALKAYERLQYARHGRLQPQVDSEGTNSMACNDDDRIVDTRKQISLPQKGNNHIDQKDRVSEERNQLSSTYTNNNSGKMSSTVTPAETDRSADREQSRSHREKARPPQQKSHKKSRSKQSRKNGGHSGNSSKGGNHSTDTKGMDEVAEKTSAKGFEIRTSTDGNIDSQSRSTKEDSATDILSSLPTEAKVQFLWAKTVPTKSSSVTLTVDKLKDTVVLHYVPVKDVYLSGEVSIPCDVYRCCLLVDNQRHSVETVDVKHYTFEVDLYIEEDDDNGPLSIPALSNQQEPDSRASVSRGSRSLSLSEGQEINDRSEESRRWTEERLQRAEARAQRGDVPRSEATTRSKSAPGILRNKDQVLQKPIAIQGSRTSTQQAANTNMEDVMEGEDGPGIRHSNRLEMLLRHQMSSGEGKGIVVERCRSESGISEGSNLKDNGYPGSIDRLHDQFCEGFKPVTSKGSEDHYTSSLGSKQSIASSEQELAQYLSDGGRDVKRDAARREVISAHSTGSRTPSGSRSRSVERNSHDRQSDRTNGYQSQESTPVPSHSGDYSYTNQSQQYLHSNDEVDMSDRRRYPSGPEDRSEKPHHGIRSSTPPRNHRPPSDFQNMIPAYTQDRDQSNDGYNPPQRLTPIAHGRSGSSDRDQGYMEFSSRSHALETSHKPAIRAPLVTNRTTPVSSKELPSGREDYHRMQDLEDTIVSLRRVVTNREKDVSEVQKEKSQLAEEVSRLKQVYETPTEGRDEKEKRINQLIREKENLTTEIWKLKRDFEQLEKTKSASEVDTRNENGEIKLEKNTPEYKDNRNPDNLDNYDPNNPRAQQRKLDLESQIQDLNEAHEATVNNLHSAETTISHLKEENRVLRMSSRQDVTDDGRMLQDELSRFQDEDGRYLRDEVSTIKQELRALRDKNTQLMADNIKLTEHLRRYDSKPQQEHSHSPSRRENRRPDPLLNGSHDSWSPTVRSKCEDDEHFSRERRRITHELRELTTPPTWSDRDYRNHGDETPYIRTANQNPYTRNKMETSKDSGKFGKKDMEVQSLGKDPQPDKFVTDRRVDTVTNQFRDTERYRESLPSRERSTDRRLDNISDRPRDDLGMRPRSRTPERVQVNGHIHRPESPPAVRRERRLSDRSDSTVELTDASPLGEYRPLDQHVPSDDFRRGIIEERLSHGTLITPGSHQLTNDLSTLHDLPPPKKRDPISDVMDNLQQPPNTRRRLKVDLVNDIIDGAKVLPNKPVIVGHLENTGSSNSVLRDYDFNEKLESQVAAPGPIQRHNSSNHGSVLDDLLDNSMEDVNMIPSRPRRDSLDSDSTEVILGIAEEEMNKYNIAKDSSGSDHQIINGKSRGLHHGTSLRSVSPRPIITQHNKGTLGVTQSHKESIHSCATKRPFAPRVAADVNIGDVVKFCRHGGKISKGLVRYIGHLPGKNDTYLGLELEHEMGKHDGVYEGQRYFQSKPNRGVFVAFSKVVMAWGE